MKLLLESIHIKEVTQGAKTEVADHRLTVNLTELREYLLQDRRLGDVAIRIFQPGQNVRLINLMDMVQPRCKIDDPGADFPGFIGRIRTAGAGRTLSLSGLAVAVCDHDTTRKYSSFLDLAGEIQHLSKYGKMPLVALSCRRSHEAEERDYEDAVKIAGLKTAVFLARAGVGQDPDEVEEFCLDLTALPKSDLPRVAYYYQLYSPQHDHNGISDKCYYGTEIRHLLPTIIHPNEVLDGGITGHQTMRSLDTYSIQNHGVIRELYKRHNKDIIFCGMVCGVANMEPLQRQRKAMMASSLIRRVLGADGVILTKIHGGMPHVDLALVADECEKLGVRTTLFVQPLVSTGTLADTSLFKSDLLDAIIVVGATQERLVVHNKPDEVFGGEPITHLFSPDPFIQEANGERVDSEQFLIAGIHDHTGGARISAADY